MPVEALHFVCPQCQARLRIQRQRRLDRRLPCPECRLSLHIESVGDGDELRVRAVTDATATSSPSRSAVPLPSPPDDSTLTTPAPIPSADSTTAGTTRRGKTGTPISKRAAARGPRSSRTGVPTTFAMLVAAATVVGLIFIAIAARILLDSPNPTPVATPLAVDVPVADVPDAEAPIGDGPVAAGPAGRDDRPAIPIPGQLAPELEDRLDRLGDRLELYVDDQVHFPPAAFSTAELPPHQQFSWIALLTDRQFDADRPAVQFERPWNSPVNDRFVRRRLPEVLNPLWSELAGGDGYPATHFVGLAGVGPESLTPEGSAARRGMFAAGNPVAPRDVLDGLGNTIMVCGITRDLGSWAAAGRPTVRPFTAAPVVDGPDGLGTVTPGGMLVLMADGRVEFVSSEIDPVVFRRMVAIADEPVTPEPTPEFETPLANAAEESEDSEPPAGPLLSDPKPPHRQPKLAIDEIGDPPLSPEFAGEDEFPRRRIDPRQTLQQPILSFEQPGTKRSQVLLDLEDLAGVPIRYNPQELGGLVDALDGRVTMSLKNTNVGEILQKLLLDTGLTHEIRDGHLRLIPRADP